MSVKSAVFPALVAIWAVVAPVSDAKAADGCVAYGDAKTDFTWRLCPAGEKYERQYIYFGVWGNFYRVDSQTGACSWSADRSGWVCPDRTTMHRHPLRVAAAPRIRLQAYTCDN
jgi:hypothetical protein